MTHVKPGSCGIDRRVLLHLTVKDTTRGTNYKLWTSYENRNWECPIKDLLDFLEINSARFKFVSSEFLFVTFLYYTLGGPSTLMSFYRIFLITRFPNLYSASTLLNGPEKWISEWLIKYRIKYSLICSELSR